MNADLTGRIWLDRLRSQTEIASHFPCLSRAMLQAFVITLREGLEAFLIVAISLAYCEKPGAAASSPPSTGALPCRSVSASGSACCCSALGTRRSGKGCSRLRRPCSSLRSSSTCGAPPGIKRQIEGRLHDSAAKGGVAAFLGVFAFTVLMISREGWKRRS